MSPLRRWRRVETRLLIAYLLIALLAAFLVAVWFHLTRKRRSARRYYRLGRKRRLARLDRELRQ